MGVKILLADDSPTVHKVIKIILANEPYDVIECPRETELMAKLAQHNPKIVFLDFNFSESLTGYDLCRSIKAQTPDAKVLMMYGTFDAIDEAVLRDSGADQHVVKPFDTNRFIFQVRALADSSSSEPLDDWNLQDTVEHDSPDVAQMTRETVSSLGDSLSDWGMNIPGVIGKSHSSPELPPVIENDGSYSIADEVVTAQPVVARDSSTVDTHNSIMPNEQDLEYPDVGGGLELEPEHKPKSRLVGLNELNPDPSEQEVMSSLELMNHSGMEEGVRKIEDQIRDELEADLWSVDSFEEVSPRLAVVKQKSIEELEEEKPAPVQAPTRAPSAGNISMDLESLRPMLEQMVKQAVQEYCRTQVDKVAWEVIPDLAENLIRKELQEMARKAAQD